MLTDHEAVLLEIMTNGEDMLAIGAHEAPLLSLAASGLVSKVGNGYRITSAGVTAFGEFENAELTAMILGRPAGDDGITIEGEMIRD
jgi:hypothetical protein